MSWPGGRVGITLDGSDGEAFEAFVFAIAIALVIIVFQRGPFNLEEYLQQ
jgi:hypothetical protein